ncbi:MAG: bifunctional folylpolyglutamate synthase/dihydrofolate synthase [Actinomycetota bacterium]|nr:bifunctional folylpolyglutamate synthase/dihydrofolate synthase [Actinomycetota bacterium]
MDLARVEAELRTRWPESRLSPTLVRMAALADALGSPQHAFPVIQITGTNGKTSTARMIDSLLRSFGLRVGRFTSPHLTSVTERIVLDGEPISEERFVEIYDEIAPFVGLVDAAQDLPLSYFEVLTGIGLAAFADAPVDVTVLEVGMGGAWDTTNVADALVAVVTTVALDHTNYLGPDVATIAGEKAGIIKPGATAVLAGQDPAAAEVLLRRVVDVDATVAREGAEFGIVDRAVAVGGQVLRLQGLGGTYEDIYLPLHGEHQAHNAVLALAAVEAFFGAGSATGPLDIDVVRAGFAAATSPGRLESVRSAPTVLLDAAHNPSGMAALVAAIEEAFDFTKLIGVLACLSDKDVRGMLEIAETVLHEVVVTENSSPRGMSADDLAVLATQVFSPERVVVVPDLETAIETAVELAEADATVLSGVGVLITGSVVTAGDARALLLGNT